MKRTLTDDDVRRYARQILLPEVGGKGQAALGRARVLCVGAGGLGSPLALYLAAAGVGTLILSDGDPVELSNLHRQILHFTPDAGKPKTLSAAEKLAALNPSVKILSRPRLDASNARSLAASCDVVADGSDNFETRYIVNDACVAAGTPLVSGAVLKWEGQLMAVLPGKSACYRCAFPEPPEPDCVQSCAEAGILGPVAGAVGSLMAVEVLKAILGQPVMADRLLVMDMKETSFRERRLRRRSGCPACGEATGRRGGPAPSSAAHRDGKA